MGSIGGGIATGPDGYEGHVTFYIAVPDIEAALQKAEELGGDARDGPGEGHGLRSNWASSKTPRVT